ncbi:LysR family transcriptional regulator [Defluviimonas aestuarii]|uniref:LysR family transcriptional regulator n=1 Tax=Albidovulum aestuarii TaxID=1130726 RepID=UPI00249CF0C4|nr:LysR family transcriptional regulator [Defluviimonas aestuarii]MDI3335074.1 LysR family transcriptional regulator [Defluviimonas aestuarii]
MSQEVEPKTGKRFAQSLDWKLIRMFHNIARAGGVSEAARQINKGQPTVSMALHRLEEHLNTSLCKRGPGGFELTESGKIVADVSEQIFDAISRIPNTLNQAVEELRGRVRIQMITNLVNDRLNRPLKNFHNDHPNVELFIAISTWDVIQRNVMRNEVEAGIGPASQHLPDLCYELLFSEVYIPYCGRSHPLYGKEISSPSQLAMHRHILTGADEPLELIKFRQKWGLGKQIAGLSEHLEEARRLTELGVGVCFLPTAFAASAVRQGSLHELMDEKHAPVSNIYLITNPKAPFNRVQNALIEYFRKEIVA